MPEAFTGAVWMSRVSSLVRITEPALRDTPSLSAITEGSLPGAGR